ncbi:MAG: sulfotransferase family protein [Gammaproteobacteria bacterium]|nr:sulfotransferase family protein [Gammaproteobacteria bacterium]
MIIIPKLNLGYQEIPKVATTSLFDWLYVSCNGEISAEERKRGNGNGVRNYFKGGRGEAFCIENATNAVEPYGAYYRFAITRDPIKRFLSMYSNRVVHHKELSSQAKCADELRVAGLNYDPEINALISRLDSYLAFAKAINHHSRPMMGFLGPDLSVYTCIVDIKETDNIINEIRACWQKVGMHDVLGRAPNELGRRQTGGPKLGLEVLHQDSFDRLLEFYREDYECIPTISLQAIKDEFSKSRALIADTKLKPKKKRVQAGGESRVRAGEPLRRGVLIKKEACSFVELIRFNFPGKGSALDEPFLLMGAVLLRPDVTSDGWQLVMGSGSHERNIDWGLPSPMLAEKFPNNRSAGSAK